MWGSSSAHRRSFARSTSLGWLNQFLPYIFTIVAVLATDILKGVVAGIVVGIFFVLRQNASGAIVESACMPTGRRVRAFPARRHLHLQAGSWSRCWTP